MSVSPSGTASLNHGSTEGSVAPPHAGAAFAQTAPAELGSVLRGYSIRLVVLAACALLLIRGRGVEIEFLQRQDAPVIGLSAALFLCLGIRPGLLRHVPAIQVPRFAPAVLVGLALAIPAVGTWLVFGNFGMSRDEFMADFDATVFASGRLAWPIAAEWRPYADALMPLFMRDVPVSAGWISDYLPGNALLRAVGDHSVGRELVNPILAAVAALALFRIARRLWPETRRTALVPLLLLTLSPQFLVMAMTPFAMTAHLTFNLLWLLCFLRDDRRGDACALALGFFATGLHQLIFHPLFAAPFIAELLIARRFRRASLFIVGYGAIGLFWASYTQLLYPVAAATGASGGLAHVADTVATLVGSFGGANLLLMLLNLLRFAAWQHLFLLVLVICAWPSIRRAQGIARPLLAGAVLMLITTFVLIPWQGHGWGYRYLHGFLGSFCLLAGYGWQRLAAAGPERRAILAVTSAMTAFLVLPALMISTRAMVEPFRLASAAIHASGAEVVLVDGSAIPFTINLIRNPVPPGGRPKVMELQSLSAAQVRALCSRYNVRLFDARNASQAGITLMTLPSSMTAARVAGIPGCVR